MKMSKAESGKLGGLAYKTNLQKLMNQKILKYNETQNKCFNCKSLLPYKKRWNKYCSRKCANIITNFNKRIPKNSRTRIEYLKEKRDNFDKRIELGLCHSRPVLKKYVIRIKQNNKWFCSVCKFETWNGKLIPLELDHIDGCAINNVPNNLRVICPNCHAQTPSSKGKNRGKGRKSLGIKRIENYKLFPQNCG